MNSYNPDIFLATTIICSLSTFNNNNNGLLYIIFQTKWQLVSYRFQFSNFHFGGVVETSKMPLFLIAKGSLQILLGTDDVFEHFRAVNLIGIGFFQLKKYLRINV